MNKYLASDKIKVYPSAKRGENVPYSRLLSEEAMTRIVNTFIDYDGFVISTNDNMSSSFKFNIKGYYFEVPDYTQITALFPNATQIYAIISLTKYGDFWELDGQDNANTYYGVTFSDTNDTSSNHYSLKIFEKSSGTWIIPDSSKYKFNFVYQQFDVDGGVIL